MTLFTLDLFCFANHLRFMRLIDICDFQLLWRDVDRQARSSSRRLEEVKLSFNSQRNCSWVIIVLRWCAFRRLWKKRRPP